MTDRLNTQIIDVVCSNCGAHHSVRSTGQARSIDVCSNCHPAYTGIARAAVGGSRIERFNRRRALAVA